MNRPSIETPPHPPVRVVIVITRGREDAFAVSLEAEGLEAVTEELLWQLQSRVDMAFRKCANLTLGRKEHSGVTAARLTIPPEWRRRR